VADETPAFDGLGVGSRLAGYRLDEQIGRGGMAVVYRAYDTRLERPVAIKVLTPELAEDEAFRQRFIRESRTAAAVDHPNIIPIFEAGEASGVLFIAMRFVQGPNVQALVETTGPLPAARACHIITQVAAALEAAHSHGLVHRDVKPANMLLDSGGGGDYPGHAYLSDFGLSKRALSVSALTSTGQFLGTLDYIAPEQIEARAVDGRTDEYALACSAYTMLSGQPPFVRDESVAVMWAQISAIPPALTTRRPDLPAAVDDVMAKALAKIPMERYATCPEFAVALRRACGLESSGTDPGQAAIFPDPPRREATRIVPAVPADPGRAPAGDTPAGYHAAGDGDTPSGDPAPGRGQPPAAFPAAAGRGATEIAGPASGGSPPDETPPPGPLPHDLPPHEIPPPGTQRADSPPEESPPWESLYRDPAPREPAPREPRPREPRPREPSPHEADPRQPAAAGPPLAADATRDVPLVTPGGYPPQPPGPTPGFRRVAPPPPSGPGRRRRGLWAIAAAGVVVVVVAVALVVAKPFSSSGKTGGSSPPPVALAAPACTTQAAKGSQLNQVASHMVTTGGNPFDIATVPGFAFVSGGGNGVAVMNTSKAVPSKMWSSSPLAHAQGEALTPDGRYLAVTGGSGLTVFQVSSLERQSGASPMGSLTTPDQKHAEAVAITPDGQYAFVTFQNTAHVGVFNLHRALTSGFGSAAFVGLIPVGPQPIGIAMAPDGQHAYVASGLDNPPTADAGVLSVIDVPKAEQHPGSSAVAKTIAAGCKPNRVVLSNSGQDLWLTAAGSNALLGFSTAKLLSDPRHALVSVVPVGQSPLGMAVISHGTRIVVADSNKNGGSGSAANLAVVSTSKALARRPALLGYLQSGVQPRQFAVTSKGDTLLVANTGSAQLQAVDLSHLP
jgi:serine/threonine protein kinase/DNA-binding beta-propeller fold protein YncE